MKQAAVYIVTNKRNGALYVGVTSNLIQRVYQHKEGIIPGFTQKLRFIATWNAPLQEKNKSKAVQEKRS